MGDHDEIITPFSLHFGLRETPADKLLEMETNLNERERLNYKRKWEKIISDHDTFLQEELKKTNENFKPNPKLQIGDLCLYRNMHRTKDIPVYIRSIFEIMDIKGSKYTLKPLFGYSAGVVQAYGNLLKPYSFSEIFLELPTDLRLLLGQCLDPTMLKEYLDAHPGITPPDFSRLGLLQIPNDMKLRNKVTPSSLILSEPALSFSISSSITPSDPDSTDIPRGPRTTSGPPSDTSSLRNLLTTGSQIIREPGSTTDTPTADDHLSSNDGDASTHVDQTNQDGPDVSAIDTPSVTLPARATEETPSILRSNSGPVTHAGSDTSVHEGSSRTDDTNVDTGDPGHQVSSIIDITQPGDDTIPSPDYEQLTVIGSPDTTGLTWDDDDLQQEIVAHDAPADSTEAVSPFISMVDRDTHPEYYKLTYGSGDTPLRDPLLLPEGDPTFIDRTEYVVRPGPDINDTREEREKAIEKLRKFKAQIPDLSDATIQMEKNKTLPIQADKTSLEMVDKTLGDVGQPIPVTSTPNITKSETDQRGLTFSDETGLPIAISSDKDTYRLSKSHDKGFSAKRHLPFDQPSNSNSKSTKSTSDESKLSTETRKTKEAAEFSQFVDKFFPKQVTPEQRQAQTLPTPILKRPSRLRKLPSRYKDFVMGHDMDDLPVGDEQQARASTLHQPYVPIVPQPGYAQQLDRTDGPLQTPPRGGARPKKKRSPYPYGYQYHD